MANTPEEETSINAENAVTKKLRIAKLIKERKAALYTRFPHLPDPFAALALHLNLEYETAKNDSEEAGTLNFRAHISGNRLWIGYSDDTNRYGDYLPIESRNDPFLKPILALSNAKDSLDIFNALISNVGFTYHVVHDAQDGNTYVELSEFDRITALRSDWKYLAACNTLHTVLDYWEEDLNVLDKKAEDNVPGVIPTMRYNYETVFLRPGEEEPVMLL